MLKSIERVITGAIVADALGAPFEFFTEAEINGEIEMNGGKNKLFTVQAGEWTDDTEMMLLLAETIGEGFNLENLAERYISWANSEPKDIGNTTRAALFQSSGLKESLKRSEDYYKKTGSCGNGTIMRAAPLAFLPGSEEIIAQEAQITHWAPEAAEASFLLVTSIKRLLSGRELAITEKGFREKTRLAIKSSKRREDVAALVKDGGSAWSSLAAALWSLNFSSYEEGVSQVIRLGYDTDTNAVCAGALLAARGDQVPSRWLDKIKDRPRIERAIKGLAAK